MPELPEVETIKRDLQRVAVGYRVVKVEVKKKNMVTGSATVFLKALVGQVITNVARRGKLLIFTLSSGKFLLTHLRMTGQLVWRYEGTIIAGGHPEPLLGSLPNKFTHIIISLDGGAKLYFNDQRQFGYMQVVDAKQLHQKLAAFGLEPLDPDFSFSRFLELFKGRKKSVKAVLLDQSIIAGIGNIYADEICFHARIRPQRQAAGLTPADLKSLFRSIKQILTKSVAHRGTTFSDYTDAHGHAGGYAKYLKVYQKEGQKCRRCNKGVIKKLARVAGRGTRYCPVCQR